MSTEKNITIAEAVRNLIVCDTQFGWSGETTLSLPELLDLKARGWLIEGKENNEFSLTNHGQAVVAQALQQAGPAELAEQQRQVIVLALADAYLAGAEGLQFGGLARLETLASALAATGKQHVGEV